ncbi:MAG: hypothetical protein SWY16_01145 [Cyanobacteriota bacterium]|nr:hypothetical protein [Cyanobacteriota bacterium]
MNGSQIQPRTDFIVMSAAIPNRDLTRSGLTRENDFPHGGIPNPNILMVHLNYDR